METLWDRQRYETASYCLTQISLYFTAMANGNSKMMLIFQLFINYLTFYSSPVNRLFRVFGYQPNAAELYRAGYDGAR